MTTRPEVHVRSTTNGDSVALSTLVTGYGLSPAAAVRDMTLTARTAAELMDDCSGKTYEVIGVRLVPGQVPDNEGPRGATVTGWCAYGTMLPLVAFAHWSCSSSG